MEKTSPSKELLMELARESIITISRSIPENAAEARPESLNTATSLPPPNGESAERYRSELISISLLLPESKGLPLPNGNSAEKYRSELISLSFQSPEPKGLPVASDPDLLENLKRHKDEDVLKGHAVKNQKALWDRTLELRFLIQKAFTRSNQLPQEPLRTSFCETDKKVDEAFKELLTSTKETLNSILELQEALLNNNPAIPQTEEGCFAESSKVHLKDLEELGDDTGEEWKHFLEMHRRMTSFRDKSLDKWYHKTQVATGAAAMKNKLHAFNQNISEQVSSRMRDPSRMIKQMQMRRSTIHIFGSEVLQCAETSEKGEPNVEGDPELLDDVEFYQYLLKEFFETLDSTSSDAAIYAVKRLQTKKRKIVDRCASKSRKIRYNVHEKLVNFMAPQPMELPPMAPKLFENMFGLKTMKSPCMV